MNSVTFKSVVTAFILFLSLGAQAQTGIISGRITDQESGEELIGVNVFVKGTQTGAATDIDGNYRIAGLKPGTYAIVVSYVSFTTQEVTGIEVKADEVTNINVQLASESVEIKEVVVSAKKLDNTEISIISSIKRSIAVQDGISSQEIKRTGAGNAAQSMKQMTGATIQDGKYLVMRGLGDRYSITQMNGLTIPSSNPYRNSTSMDLIPSGMIDNITTLKTFTPEQPGNFTGGNVNIKTRSFPDKFQLNVSTGFSFNTQSSFINNFLTQSDGGNRDWLGYDDGTRALPTILANEENRRRLATTAYLGVRNENSDPGDRAFFNDAAKSLNHNFVPVTKSTPMNSSFGFSVGNQLKLFKKPLGYVIGANLKRNFNHYDAGATAGWQLTDPEAEGLLNFFNLQDTRSEENTQLGGMANLAYQFNKTNELSVNFLYSHDGEISTRSQTGLFPFALSTSDAQFTTTSLFFTERELTSTQLRGRHVLTGLRGLELTWTAGISNSSQFEPDLKFFAYQQNNDGNFFMNKAEYDFPFHFFRTLEDQQVDGKIDFTLPITEKKGNKIMFGGAITSKERDFEELRFQVENEGTGRYTDPNDPLFSPNALSFNRAGGDFAAFFNPNNFGIVDTNLSSTSRRYVHHLFLINQSRATNAYTGTENVYSAYAMGVYAINSRLKFVGGVRMEITDIEVISGDTSAPRGTIDTTDFLPSINLIYALNSKMNLRGAYTQTLARPNMRELAPFAAFDFIGGFIFLGNPNIKRTLINNYDLRWEFFPRAGELLAVGAYYKQFDNPIIMVFNPKTSNPEIRFQNVEQAQVYGVEVELKKKLDILGPAFKNFRFGGNVSYIFSEVSVDTAELRTARQFNPDFEDTRPFQGQSPYIVNAIVSYLNDSAGLNATLSFNVSGNRLDRVSLFGTPDIYQVARPILNLNVSQRLNKYFTLGVGLNNLINPKYEKKQTYNDQDFINESFRVGRTFSLSLSYRVQ